MDTTGCGDVYHGAFLSGYLKGGSLKENAKLASAAGALNAKKVGGRGNLSDENKIKDFLRTAEESSFKL